MSDTTDPLADALVRALQHHGADDAARLAPRIAEPEDALALNGDGIERAMRRAVGLPLTDDEQEDRR